MPINNRDKSIARWRGQNRKGLDGHLGIQRHRMETLFIGPIRVVTLNNEAQLAIKGPRSIKFLRDEIAPVHLIDDDILDAIYQRIDRAVDIAKNLCAEDLVGDLDKVAELRAAVLLMTGGMAT